MLLPLRTVQRWTQSALLGIALLPFVAQAQSPGLSANEVSQQVQQLQRTVVTFAGYSGAGYQDPASMLKRAEEVLAEYNPETTIINIGATAEGIGAIYPLAKKMKFTTIGIVSTQASDTNTPISTDVDHVFYVTDASWGGKLADSDKLSPTSEAMVNNSDVFIAIGGGAVSRDEYLAAQAQGKEVIFIAADMDHKVAIEKAKRKGQPQPTDFSGDLAIQLQKNQ